MRLGAVGSSLRALAWVGLAACAGPPRDDGSAASERAALTGSAPDATRSFVVALADSVPAQASVETCTGVLVAPRVVVTAAHCITNRDPSAMQVLFGADSTSPDATLGAAQVIRYPTQAADFARAGMDLGVVVLAADAPVAPVPFAHRGQGPTSGSALAVGYGSADGGAASGARAATTVGIAGACDRLLRMGDGEHRACAGDSGGPLLVPAATGGEMAIAVMSFNEVGACGAPEFAVRLDAYADWLDAVVAGRPDASCASTCPPPTQDCLGGDGGGAESDAAEAPPAVVAGGGCAAARGDAGASWWLVAVVTLGARRARPRSPRPSSACPRGPTGSSDARARWSSGRRPCAGRP